MFFFDTKVLTTAAISAICTIAAIKAFESISKSRVISNIKAEFVVKDDWDFEINSKEQEKLLEEQLSRNISFLGEKGVEKLKNAFVIVIGVGGVGSHAAHMLCRSGIGKIRLIDFDQVTLSSLNRHAVANRKDVGKPKVSVMKNHLKLINPVVEIEDIVELFNREAASRLLGGEPDFVLDCIDNLETKADLIKYCCDNNIKIISSMGAGAKADPSRIQIADISSSFEDPLARSTRRKLRFMGCHDKIPVVFSNEKPGDVSLLPLDDTQVEEADQYASLPSFRSRILPVLGTIPALFGNAMASYVITELAGFKTEPICKQNNRRIFEKLFKELYAAELLIQGKDKIEMKVNVNDVGFIFEDVWGCRSAISGATLDRLILTRWNPNLEATFGNLICMTKKEAKKHRELKPEDFCSEYGQDFLDMVEQKFKKEKYYLKWRE